MVRTLLVPLLLAASLLPAQAEEQLLDRIVAVVNDDVVLLSEFEAELAAVRAQLRQRNVRMPPAEELRRQVLERLVMQTLQLNVAERQGITVDSATLDAAVRRVAEQNNMSLSRFRDALSAEGLTMAEFRERLRREIVLSRLRQREMQRRVNVTDQEIEQFLAQNRDGSTEYRLAQILISVPEAASAEAIEAARAEAESVLAELEAGADFATVAATYSDARNALEGGDLGWRSAAQVPEPVADRVAQMSPGDITPVLRSPAGFHVFQLQDRRSTEQRLVTQTRVRHILIEPNEVVTDTDARLRLESLRERIQGGASFAELAQANSDDAASASEGGSLGWIDPAATPPQFEEVLRSLEPGELSEPFRTRSGWHLVLLEERRQRDVTEQIARAEAARAIRERKEEEQTELWLRELREEAFVEYRLGEGLAS